MVKETMNTSVAKALQAKNLTQTKLAEMIQKPPETLNRWLKRKQQAPLEEIEKIANILDISPGALLFDNKPLKLIGSRNLDDPEVKVFDSINAENTEVNVPFNMRANYRGVIIRDDKLQQTGPLHGGIYIYDMQNYKKTIDQRSFLNFSLTGGTRIIDGKKVYGIYMGSLIPSGETYGVNSNPKFMVNSAIAGHTKLIIDMTVEWSCPLMMTLSKPLI